MVEGGWKFMKRAPTDKPNLDDVLARDFSELKAGEKTIETETPTSTPEKTEQKPAKPKVYNQRIDAVEDREAFVVKAPSPEANDSETEDGKAPKQVVLKAPSFQPGDDFDVDW